MNRLWKTVLVVVYILGNIDRYFVFGKWNQSCVTHEYSCSVCCASSRCHEMYGFPNACVDGCKDGHRGVRCYELCDFTCKTCDNATSYCDSCFDGFYLGIKHDCKSRCPSSCKTCTSDTYCQTCKEGFVNKDGFFDCRFSNCPENCYCNVSTCVLCKDGFFDTGESCTNKCPDNCYNCSTYTDCHSCKDGFYSSDDQKVCSNRCYKDCISCSSYDKCLNCNSGKFGRQCQNNCSIGCKDNVCLIETGKCNCLPNFDDETCSDCVSGYYGFFCDKECPVNCENNTCRRTLGNCLEGCKSPTMTGNYCENCIVGKYGSYCEKNCSQNCLNNICDKKDGTCSEGCKDGFNGPFCFECLPTKYGDGCKDDCPDTCKDNICEKQSGHCYKCVEHFDGLMCDICKHGFYGSDCKLNCSSSCLKVSCNKNSGECYQGCKNDYSGDMCCINNKNCLYCKNNTACRECESGYFGQSCNQTCSDLCINNVCEMNTGICTEGCIAVLDNPICAESNEQGKVDNQNVSKDTLVAVFATLFAILTVALCVLISRMVLRKLFTTKRRNDGTMVRVCLENATPEMQNISNNYEIEENENVAYETLDGTQNTINDHIYGSANGSGNRDTAGCGKYVNMQL